MNSLQKNKTIVLKKAKETNGNEKQSRGFSLFELLVSIAIFTILTTVILVKNSRFKGDILVTNIAYQVALAIREAQVYGINVKGYQTSSDVLSTEVFQHQYGIHFTTNPNNTFTLFADINDNSNFDGADRVVESFTLDPGYTIQSLCVTGAGAEDCSASGLDIFFKRPNPAARIFSAGSATAMTSSRIILVSPSNIKKAVVVQSTGQISVIESGVQ